MYLVPAWIEMSMPRAWASKKRGVPQVESQATGAPTRRAIATTASTSIMRIVPEVGTSMKTRLVSSLASALELLDRLEEAEVADVGQLALGEDAGRLDRRRPGSSTRLRGEACADIVAAMAVRPLPVAMHDSVPQSSAMAVCSSKVVLVPIDAVAGRLEGHILRASRSCSRESKRMVEARATRRVDGAGVVS